MPVTHSLGFTLVELLVTLAILALLASMAVPIAQVSAQRAKEQELRLALRELRNALDAYKKASDEGHIRKAAGASGYPKSLEVLVQGEEDQRDPKRKKLYFLREIPRDPMHQDPNTADEQTWAKRAYANEPDNLEDGDDIYDVRSKSARVGLNGVPYKKW